MTDFGAGSSFTRATIKLQEHYGISIPISGERTITLRHAKQIKQQLKQKVIDANKCSSKKALATRKGSAFIISETDGSMIPILVPNKSSIKNRSKSKEVIYREARLTLAHASNSATPHLLRYYW